MSKFVETLLNSDCKNTVFSDCYICGNAVVTEKEQHKEIRFCINDVEHFGVFCCDKCYHQTKQYIKRFRHDKDLEDVVEAK